MSSDRETRARLEQVQTRLKQIQPELELKETPGFGDEVHQLERTLDLARQRVARTQSLLLDVQNDLADASRTVRELELAAQARQTNQPSDVLAGVAAVVMILIIVAGAVLISDLHADRHVAAGIGIGSAFALGVLLRARVLRPKPPLRFR